MPTLVCSWTLLCIFVLDEMGIMKNLAPSIASILLLLLLSIPLLFIISSLFRPQPTTRRLDFHRPPNSSYPVRFAYLISASKGDVEKLKRVVVALYHPANCYLLHLDREASDEERGRLAAFVRGQPVFAEMGNLWIVGRSNLVTYRGPTMLANTLHGLAVLLRVWEWDWFINLSASDYPLVTQDDLISAFSNLPRDLNFIHHNSKLGWKLDKRAKPIIIDPGLYSRNKSDVFWASEERALPSAFKLFTGSAWVVLSRSLAEYSIVGWDNLPRTLLLYYTNFLSSPEGYFQTLACNSPMHRNVTLAHDLHFVKWDDPPKQHPLSLGLRDYRKMILSGAPFARKFDEGDPVLDKIDREILHRHQQEFSYGGWCTDTVKECTGSSGGRYGALRPGPGSRRLRALITKVLTSKSFRRKRCAK